MVANEKMHRLAAAAVVDGIGKGRDIETGTVRSCFNGQYSRFDPLAPGWIEPEYKQDKPKRRGMD